MTDRSLGASPSNDARSTTPLRVLKWDVPVDDQPHEIGAGRVMHVACQRDSVSVQVWTLELGEPHTRFAQAFGTGQPLPGSVTEFIGSALAGPFVWHVFEVRP